MAKILQRSLGERPVLVAEGVTRALRMMERSRRVAVVVSNYRLSDGTARKLFAFVSRRWPRVRRILYSDTPRPKTHNAKLAVELAHAVVVDFSELRSLIA
jgi:DNA-binding NtrC family response regulator